ncbi:ribonuclease HII [Aureibaculum conchae]|uniref:ribonuclease HII n=1 Tax=Aureibaculum sp. 2308TA14-22 TaxID=3108392 RepID=UPI003396CC19
MLQLNFSGLKLEAGTDEAGRGCLSGPVVAAAVILPDKFEHPLLNDSKQLSEKQRAELKPFIEKNALTFAIGFVWQDKIDEINILQSSILAMHQAIGKLKIEPEFIIVDGNRFKNYKEIPYETIVKGDGKYLSIAAASVLAKTYRDEYMEKIHNDFPQYNWKQNKGYPTKQHRLAIEEFGVTEHHRKSFRLLAKQLQLNLKN